MTTTVSKGWVCLVGFWGLLSLGAFSSFGAETPVGLETAFPQELSRTQKKFLKFVSQVSSRDINKRRGRELFTGWFKYFGKEDKSGFQDTPSGRALFAYILFHNGLELYGIQSLFKIPTPSLSIRNGEDYGGRRFPPAIPCGLWWEISGLPCGHLFFTRRLSFEFSLGLFGR